MTALYGAGEPVDVLTVANQLQRTGELEHAGGRATIDALTAATPAVANLRRYARIVHDHAYMRAVLAATYEIDVNPREVEANSLEITRASLVLNKLPSLASCGRQEYLDGTSILRQRGHERPRGRPGA